MLRTSQPDPRAERPTPTPPAPPPDPRPPEPPSPDPTPPPPSPDPGPPDPRPDPGPPEPSPPLDPPEPVPPEPEIRAMGSARLAVAMGEDPLLDHLQSWLGIRGARRSPGSPHLETAAADHERHLMR
jgi:hypothetical protein